MNKFYITTPIYYANAKPHIGHAYTTVVADVLARFHRAQDEDVFFLTGMDEHGLKIQKTAEAAKKDPQKFVDGITEGFKNLWSKDKLNIKYDNFIRTTDPRHKAAVQKVLQTLYDKKAIYKGEYEGLYCVGCEQFKTETELIDGKCPDHNIAPELLREECYLMKMTDIQKELTEKIESDEFKITPEKYKNEIISFLRGQILKDISISRKNVKWGIELPFDKEHTTYVWVDALLNYLTGLGWDGDANNIPDKWPVDVQLLGKDIVRVHSTIWPAILLHLGIKLPKMIFCHGHILSGGKKMSKTMGNVISIDEMLEKFGTDGTRYLLLSAGTFGEDVDITMERMIEKYNADLANGLGNLVSRVVKLSSNLEDDIEIEIKPSVSQKLALDTLGKFIDKADIGQAIGYIWNIMRDDNKFIEDNKPWELAKRDKNKFISVMFKLNSDLVIVSEILASFMPETAKKIKNALETKKVEPLFQRIK